MGSQVRILSIRLAWEYHFPWISPGREDARAVRPAAPAGGINTSVTTGKKGSKSVGERRYPSPIRRASPGRSLGSQPSLFRLADYTSPPCDVSEKSTAMRMWCSGSTPASQAGNRGFEPRHPLYPEKNQNNGFDPTMGLVTVLSMWTLPEKTWTNSLGMGTHRQGREHAIAPVAQRKSRCLLSTGSGYRNSVGARCLVHRHA